MTSTSPPTAYSSASAARISPRTHPDRVSPLRRASIARISRSVTRASTRSLRGSGMGLRPALLRFFSLIIISVRHRTDTVKFFRLFSALLFDCRLFVSYTYYGGKR